MHAKYGSVVILFSSDDVFDVAEYFASQVVIIVIDSWHVLMFGDTFYGCISTPP
jgi:hypothetical protein